MATRVSLVHLNIWCFSRGRDWILMSFDNDCVWVIIDSSGTKISHTYLLLDDCNIVTIIISCAVWPEVSTSVIECTISISIYFTYSALTI